MLIPSSNKEFVKTVKLIFDLFALQGLSRRKISKLLNDEGRTFYDKPFTHSLVSQILRNPAYVGDTHFGKTQTGELHSFVHSFDGNLVVELKHGAVKQKRDVAKRLVKKNTHKGLITRETWKLAQQKLASQEERTSYAPRNPAYYLKEIFVCGHCGKNLSGRTEIDQKTKRRGVVYMCQSYLSGQQNGQEKKCGAYRITHEIAEKLLFDKLKEREIHYDATASDEARRNLENRLARMERADDESMEQWTKALDDGVKSLLTFLKESYRIPANKLKKLEIAANHFYWGGKMTPRWTKGLPMALSKFKEAIAEAESVAVKQAEQKMTELQEQHRKVTLEVAYASDRAKKVLKDEQQRLDAAMSEWEPRSTPLTQRLKTIFDAEAFRQAEREKLLKEWPTMESREKGEALRRIFKKVVLFWKTRFGPPLENPSRPRKTNRKGKNFYVLLSDQIQWDFADANLGASW